MSVDNKYNELVERTIIEFEANCELDIPLFNLTNITNFNLFLEHFNFIWSIAKKIVLVIEEEYNEGYLLNKDECINVAVQVIDKLIDFKGWMSPLELIDGLIWKIILSSAVQSLNDVYGHDWSVRFNK